MLALLKQPHFIFKQTFKYSTHELRTKFNKSARVREYVQLVNIYIICKEYCSIFTLNEIIVLEK